MNAGITESVTTSCARCGRRLTSARSIAAGYGATCRARISAATRTAQLADWQADQVADALELIEDAAIVQLRRTVFRSVSSRGTEHYLTAPQACNCPAGLRGRRCYHRAAVQILLAA